jgi:hypothetical protein
MVVKNILPIAAAILSLSAGSAFAFGVQSGTSTTSGSVTSPGIGQRVLTPRGSVAVTGNTGQTQTTLSARGVQGIMTNNGNGTSTIMGANGSVRTVVTPR